MMFFDRLLKKLVRKYGKSAVIVSAVVFLSVLVLGSTLAFVVTRTPSLINKFISGLEPEGNLIIRKTVEHPFGEDYEIPGNVAFTFRVELGAGYAGQPVKTTQGEQTADENGIIYVTVKPGNAVSVQEILAGTQVTVTEMEKEDDGFTVQDAASQTTTIQAREDVVTAFLNRYAPGKVDPVNLNLTGVKTLEGRDWKEGDAFTFLLEYRFVEDGVDTWTAVGTQSVAYELIEVPDPEDPEQTIWVEKPDFNRFDFTQQVQALSFDKHGTYAFRLSEVEGTIGGITYDETYRYFDVVVGDADMDGKLEIQNVDPAPGTEVSYNVAEDMYYATVVIQNDYAPTGSVEANIEIHKTVEDKSGQNKAPSGFVFELYDADGQLIKASNPTTAAGETSIKLIFDASHVGKTYTYTLKELGSGETVDGMTYDDTEYRISITIIDNLDGTVSAVVYETPETLASDEKEMEFTEQDTAASEQETATGEQETESTEQETESTEQETETIQQETETIQQETESTEQETETIQQETESTEQESETIQQETESADQESETVEPGTETTEQETEPAEQESETVEPGTETTEQETEPAEQENLSAETNTTEQGSEQTTNSGNPAPEQDKPQGIPADATDTCLVTFENVYDPKDASTQISGTKTLEGRELKEEEFTFHLYQTGSDFAVGAQDRPVSTAVNAADGSFRFDKLTFERVGTYYYVVTEDASAKLGGVAYDEGKYLVTVTVTDQNGTLTAEQKITNAYGETARIRFRNTYAAASVSKTLCGTKTLQGAQLREGMFQFSLYTADENFTERGQLIQVVSNQADGKIVFSELKFTNPGVYRFIVVENNANPLPGTTYDSTVYGIAVIVKDDGVGHLTATMTITEVGKGMVDSMVFENVYKVEPTEPSTPTEPSSPTEPTTKPTKPTEPDPITPTEPTTKPSKPSKPDSPQTGDDSNIFLHILLASQSATFLVLLALHKISDRRRKSAKWFYARYDKDDQK